MLTPALSSGLLAGTLRADLLASGRAREAVLTLNDLEAVHTRAKALKALAPYKVHGEPAGQMLERRGANARST